MHGWTLTAVGPWIGLGVAYGLSVRSLLRQGRQDRQGRADGRTLRIVPRNPDFSLEASQAARVNHG